MIQIKGNASFNPSGIIDFLAKNRESQAFY